MKSIVAVVILCALLAVNHALLRRFMKSMKINKNEASSSSESEVKKDGSCLMHFVDKRFFDHVYIANGALVNINKVLTTRDVLQPYENNIKQEELFVYHEEWKNDNLTQKVTEVYIDKRGISKLAVAKLEKPFEPNEVISTCVASILYSQRIGQEEIAISGWRFADHKANSKILSKDALFSTLHRRECNSRRPKQESYHRFSRAATASIDEYKDYNSLMYYGDEGAPVTLSKDRLKLVAITSFKEKVFITFASSAVFFQITSIADVETFPSINNERLESMLNYQ